MRKSHRTVFVLLLGIALFVPAIPRPAVAGGKLAAYGIYMVPRGSDAKTFSRPGLGGGVLAVFPLPNTGTLLGGVAGFEVVNLLSKTTTFFDDLTGLRVEQQTSQNYMRLFVGAELGPHGRGFLRPHVGANLALVIYDISTDVVIPDDYDREKEIRQKLRSKTRTVFGSDITAGLDLNFNNRFSVDGGVRFVKSFSLPEQLGEDAVKVHPEYFQIYLGASISFRQIKKSSAQR